MQPQEDYKIVEAPNAKALSTAVHNEMVGGDRWQPIGGVSANGGVFYQAMLRGARRGGGKKTLRRRRA